MELYANQAYLHEFEGGVLVRDTRRVMPFHLDPWVANDGKWIEQATKDNFSASEKSYASNSSMKWSSEYNLARR